MLASRLPGIKLPDENQAHRPGIQTSARLERCADPASVRECAEDISIPCAEFSTHFTVHFCRASGQGGVSVTAQPGFVNFRWLGVEVSRKRVSVFHLGQPFAFRWTARHRRFAPPDGHCSTIKINLPAWICPSLNSLMRWRRKGVTFLPWISFSCASRMAVR